MRYDEIQALLEEYVQNNWTDTAIQFDNVAFNSDIYEEYLRCTVILGEGMPKSLTIGCYRVVGLLVLTVFVKPAEGVVRMLQLASQASNLVIDKVVGATPPTTLPKVRLKVPSLVKDTKERAGFVFAQVSCPFYYDLEI